VATTIPTARRSSTSSFGPRPTDDTLPRLLRWDWTLLGATVALCAFGLVAVHSARWRRLQENDPANLYFYVQHQAVPMAIGALGMLVFMALDYRQLKAWTPRLYVGTSLMLALVLVLGTDPNRSGTRAWFDLGTFTLQPAEFAKLTIVLGLAAVVSNDRDGPLSYARFVAALVVLGIPVGLIMLQPDLGTASTFIVVAMAVLLVGRARFWHILLISVLSLVTVVALVQTKFLAPYQVARLTSFVDPNAKKIDPAWPKDRQQQEQLINGVREQVRYAQQAVSLGGLHGQGFANGITMNGGYVSQTHTDFIFANVAEQFGLVGAGIVLLLYLVILLRTMRIAQLANNAFGTLICVGGGALLAWHVFENVGMNMGIMPVTGIPLPLVSYGGSSAMSFLWLLGFVQNVYRRRAE
jgi:rod shape determining protein RodA